MKWLGVVLVFVGAPAPLCAQRQLPWTDPVPELGAGDRVRVWGWKYGTQVYPGQSRFLLGTHRFHVSGNLVFYRPPDSLRIRATGWSAALSLSTEQTILWENVARIDKPNGRDVLGGVARGAGLAISLAAAVSITERAFGCSAETHCGGFWKRAGQYSLITIPLGAAAGFLTTRWKRIY
jgi:hypothetical protein